VAFQFTDVGVDAYALEIRRLERQLEEHSMSTEQPTIEVTAFPEDVSPPTGSELVPKRIYARVSIPEGNDETYNSFRFLLRVRPLVKLGAKDEPFTETTKGDIRDPQLDDPSINYRMDLIEGYAPFTGGRPVPGPGWFEVFDLDAARVREDVEVEAFLFRHTGRWCAERRITLRRITRPARLVHSFPLLDTRGLIAIGDLDNDGQLEFLNSAGAERQTAYRADGQVMWDHHDPAATRISTHNCLFPIYDIDGDGRKEVIAMRHDGGNYYLCILEGSTGAVKRRIALPKAVKILDDPPMVNIQVANLRGMSRASDIVFSHHYSDITALDQDLNILWCRDLWANEGKSVECPPLRSGAEARFPYGFGHTPACGDLDGDGHDEIVAGATLIDHDGRFLWNRKDLPRINADHNDSVAIADLDRNGKLAILLSTGLWCLDTDGSIRWGFGHTVCHGQHVWAGPIIPGSPRLQIILVDWRCYMGLQPPHTVYLLDADGRVYWHRVTGWAIPMYWSSYRHQDIWLQPEEMPGVGEIVDYRCRTLGYLPAGRLEGIRPFLQPGGHTDTVVTKTTRGGKGTMEFYECAVAPPIESGQMPPPRPHQDDDWHYSLY
jgi:hypothetical protein